MAGYDLGKENSLDKSFKNVHNKDEILRKWFGNSEKRGYG